MPRLLLLLACLLGLVACAGRAQAAAFDLAGPSLRISVTRAGTTLPLAQVPGLAAGDRLRVALELPAGGDARYRMVLAFLRGATSPPPKEWLFDARTWKAKRSAIEAAVPAGAEQVLVLLVPDTAGAVDAVRQAIRGRPGAFVRASQELNQAMLDRARLETFLREVTRLDPAEVADASPRLAQSLGVKLDAECLGRQPALQAACLTQASNAVVLADAQTNSLAQTLAGAPADIALQLSSTPQGGYGYYSPYIGVVRDLARILGAFQSAQLQFVPALSVQAGATTRLLLNTAPSFQKPHTVLVAVLPPVMAVSPPALQARGDGAICASRPGAVLPVSGAPLVFATDYARDVALRVRATDGGVLDLPVTADASRGAYVLAEAGSALDASSEGVLHGLWGFAPFDGPRFRLAAPVAPWRPSEGASLIVGRDAPLVLDGGAAACVSKVLLQRGEEQLPVTWKAQGDHRMSLEVPLTGAEPGRVTILVYSHGAAEPQRLALQTYAEIGNLAGFTLHEGDREGVLAGTRLDQVTALDLAGVAFRPGGLSRVEGGDRLTMTTAADPGWHAGEARQARVSLRDGRTMGLKVTVARARPAVTLLNRTVERAPGPVRLAFAAADVVPADARLEFSFAASGAARFRPADKVEVDAPEAQATASLPIRLQDARVAVATLDPAALGSGARGPLRFRLVQDGVAGDWQPLGVLVRVPRLASFACDKGRCRLSGADLFLIRSVSVGNTRVAVPDGFTGSVVEFPQGAGDAVLALRDGADARTGP